MLVLPTLYKPAKSGATQQFEVIAIDGKITIAFGQVDGKKQTKDTICSGKNLGRSNETTAQQQAELEAKSKWEKKLKEGYSLTIEAAPSVNLPMKVHTYQEHSSKIKFPCYVSPKLNGVNAEYRLLPEPQILSRGGEIYPYVPSRDDHVFGRMKDASINSINGEIYLHGQHLQDIMSAVKKPSQDKLQPEFFAFDLPCEPGRYFDRARVLKTLGINVISIDKANSHEDILEWHRRFVSDGYEGTIIRNIDGLYEYNTRSYDVLKLKDVLDAEYKIVGYNIDKNGHPVLVCETAEEIKFSVKPKGSNSDRLDIVKNITEYMLKWYKIEYEVLSKDGIPLKPVGIGLRKCDTDGKPLE